jgi:NAD(P)-dependent dehydrogenase (short-subunit alcohol dehydrogenase family)
MWGRTDKEGTTQRRIPPAAAAAAAAAHVTRIAGVAKHLVASMSKSSKLEAVVVVTGANRGIGLAFAQYYSNLSGIRVVAGCREPKYASELAVLRNVDVYELDVEDDKSVQAFVAKLKQEHNRTDLLINNAGILVSDSVDSPTLLQDVQRQFSVNALGPLRVTTAMLPVLRATPGCKVVNITSRMGSIGDNSSGKYYGYRASKAALNAMSVSLAHDLKPIPVVVVHPGMVSTDMVNFKGDISPQDAVKRMAGLIEKVGPEESGKFFHRDGQELPW